MIKVEGLTETKKRALLLADNKIAENAGWDRKRLAVEIPELSQLLIEESLDISLTGFEAVEIDQLAIDFEEKSADPADCHSGRLAFCSNGEPTRRPMATRRASSALR